MNLKDKLKAIEKPRTAPAPEKQFTDCWRRDVVRDLSEFPGAFELRGEAVALMQRETVPEPLDPTRILYLDTETTGLSGGTGTVAFEVGLGWLRADGFHIRQLLMRDYPEERFLLSALAEVAQDFDVLCTFNGRSFDVPLLRTRFLMNRMRTDCLDKPHIDLLHIARRVFKLRLKSCTLSHLEEAILGLPRLNDLPGALVPERFFSYLKTGRFELFDEVLEHNEQDVASMCVLLAHMARKYEHPEELAFGEDLYSMGVALERFDHPQEARRCYHLASQGEMRGPAQLRLATSYRRAGERLAAVQVWQGMIDRREGGAVPYVELAKHYEHVEKDISAALRMTRRAIAMLAEPTLLEPPEVQEMRSELQYRYDRLKRKEALHSPDAARQEQAENEADNVSM